MCRIIIISMEKLLSDKIHSGVTSNDQHYLLSITLLINFTKPPNQFEISSTSILFSLINDYNIFLFLKENTYWVKNYLT